MKQNIAKAKSELAAAGVSNPSLTLEFPSDFTLEGVSFTTMAQAVQSDLKKIGLNVTGLATIFLSVIRRTAS